MLGSIAYSRTLIVSLIYSAVSCHSQSPVYIIGESLNFHKMSTAESRHYGEWALSSWYDIIPGPDRLLEVSTSLNEDDAWHMVYSWTAKLLTAGIGPDKLQGITDSLVHHHWNQAKRMGCLGIQFTYINGFYHRFIWRSSWLRFKITHLEYYKCSCINVSMLNSPPNAMSCSFSALPVRTLRDLEYSDCLFDYASILKHFPFAITWNM